MVNSRCDVDSYIRVCKNNNIDKIYFDVEVNNPHWTNMLINSNISILYDKPSCDHVVYMGMWEDPKVVKDFIKLPKLNNTDINEVF